MGNLIWPAVIALVATVGIVFLTPSVLGLFSKGLAKPVGRWLRRRAVAIFAGLFVGELIWWNFLR